MTDVQAPSFTSDRFNGRTTGANGQTDSYDPKHSGGLEPMTVGQIVDRSLRLTPTLFRSVFVFVLIAGVFDGVFVLARLYEARATKGGVFVAQLAYMYWVTLLRIVAILYGASIWHGQVVPRVADLASHVRIRRMFAGVRIGFRVAFVGGLGLICFIVPGVIYILNRSLAFQILYLENCPRKEALTRSVFLMTQEPFLRSGSPKARMSLLVGIQLFTSGVASLLILAAPFWLARSGAGAPLQALANAVGSVAIEFFGMFYTLCVIGFYFDLRARYEGSDLLRTLDENESANLPPSK